MHRPLLSVIVLLAGLSLAPVAEASSHHHKQTKPVHHSTPALHKHHHHPKISESKSEAKSKSKVKAVTPSHSKSKGSKAEVKHTTSAPKVKRTPVAPVTVPLPR